MQIVEVIVDSTRTLRIGPVKLYMYFRNISRNILLLVCLCFLSLFGLYSVGLLGAYLFILVDAMQFSRMQ